MICFVCLVLHKYFIFRYQLAKGVNTVHIEIFDERTLTDDELIAWVNLPIPEVIYQVSELLTSRVLWEMSCYSIRNVCRKQAWADEMGGGCAAASPKQRF